MEFENEFMWPIPCQSKKLVSKIQNEFQISRSKWWMPNEVWVVFVLETANNKSFKIPENLLFHVNYHTIHVVSRTTWIPLGIIINCTQNEYALVSCHAPDKSMRKKQWQTGINFLCNRTTLAFTWWWWTQWTRWNRAWHFLSFDNGHIMDTHCRIYRIECTYLKIWHLYNKMHTSTTKN